MKDAKRCPRCKWWLKPEAFRSDGRSLQSYCFACKDEWEREPNGIYRRMMAWLRANEPEVAALWTEEIWLEKYHRQDGKCHYCQSALSEWQFGGIRLDRQNNKEDHRPENTVLGCYPCNITRGTKNVATYQRIVESLKRDYGGHVNWAEADNRFKRTPRRSTAHLRVRAPQPSLFGDTPEAA